MIHAIGLFLALLALGYVAYLWRFATGFRQTVLTSPPAPPPEASGDLPTVSVIVAARNEEVSIGACLDAILANDFPEDRVEILVADDDSADGTADVVRTLQSRVNASGAAVGQPAVVGEPDFPPEASEPGRLRLVHVEHDPTRLRAHKKRAIETAVAHARGDIILTTDADCIVPTAWVRTMAAAFADPEVVFASGPVRYDAAGGLFARLQALDFLGLMACGAGGIATGRPNLANGACVAYRRDVFEHLGGFSGIDDVTSGDDELLMQKIAYGRAGGYGPESVRFVNRPEATVVTDPVRTLPDFLDQRKRWASKGTRYPRELQSMLILFVAFFLGIAATTVALPLAPGLWPYLLGALGLKAVGDLSILVPATGRFRQRPLLWVYPLYGPLHVFHSVVVGILGPLNRGFRWKGRTLDR